VICTEYGIGGDAGGVIVRQAGEQARPEHGKKCSHATDACCTKTRELPRNAAFVV
jgi:hypothetical protein